LSPAKGQAAFTLLELLVSIALFAIVIGTVYGVYRSTFMTVAGTEETIELMSRGRQALQRMGEDLANLRFGAGGYLLSEERDMQGQRADRLEFVSELHLALRRDDRYRSNTLIVYEVKEDDDGNRSLYRTESILYPGGSSEDSSRPYLLCRNILSFAFAFSDEEQEDAPSWQSSEDGLQEALDSGSTPKLPRLIHIDLRLQKGDDDENGIIFKTSVARELPTGS